LICGALLAMFAYRKNEGKRTLRLVGSSSAEPRTTGSNGERAPLDFDFVLVCANDRGVLALLVILHCNLFYLNFCCSEEATFGDFDSDDDWEDDT
jgi:hypothetical protein